MRSSSREFTPHTHTSYRRERAQWALLLLWCNGDCAVGSKRGVEWVSSTVEEKQPPTVPEESRQPRTRRQQPSRTLCMGTLSQMCPLALQLVVSWRLERFYTPLRDVAAAAARQERHQHPVRSEPKTPQPGVPVHSRCIYLCSFIISRGFVALSSSPQRTMAERTSAGLLSMMLEPTPAVAMTLPAEVREKLAELELELSEGKWSSDCRARVSWLGSRLRHYSCAWQLSGPPPINLTFCVPRLKKSSQHDCSLLIFFFFI